MRSDLTVLGKMIKSPHLERHKFAKNKEEREIHLIENNDDINYTVTINDMPLDCVVIKSDSFEILCSQDQEKLCRYEGDKCNIDTILKSGKGEARKSDYVIICQIGEQKMVIHIELKGGTVETGKFSEIWQKMKGSKCFAKYILEIGKEFWSNGNCIDAEYTHRYVLIAEITGGKFLSVENPQGTGDNPEDFLHITQRNYLYFKELLS